MGSSSLRLWPATLHFIASIVPSVFPTGRHVNPVWLFVSWLPYWHVNVSAAYLVTPLTVRGFNVLLLRLRCLSSSNTAYMSSGAIQGQWALDATAATAFSFLRGFIKASSNDNVQPFALYACERFGNTLAISAQTIRKIQTTMVPTPTPATIAFLNASIGYSRDTCATQLGQTTPGQRFLALAAALVTSIGPFHGAQAINVMMERSVVAESPAESTPSNQNLAAILNSLVARSLRCGFQDMMVTWGVLLRQTLPPYLVPEMERALPLLELPSPHAQAIPVLQAIPSPEAIAEIVDAFRQVARLGYTSVTGVTIKARAGAAWILAFTQWCLDIPPSLFIDDKKILDPPGSLIKIVIPTSSSEKSMEVIVHHEVKSLSALFKPANQYSSHGMINIETYQKWVLSELKFGSLSGQRLLNQVFEYAIPQILSNMTSGRFGRLGRNSDFVAGFVVNDNDPLDSHRLSLLPDIRKISDVCRLILPQDTSQRFTRLQNGLLIEDLPLVSLEHDRIRLTCKCMECSRLNNAGPNNYPSSSVCGFHELLNRFSAVIMDVFALSLFERPESIMLHPTLARRRGDEMKRGVMDVLKTGKPVKYADEDLVDWARSMVAHEFDDEDCSLLVTSNRGQVIYPSIYEAFHFERTGYLRLVSYDGVLTYNGDIYDVVTTSYDQKRQDSDASDLSDASDVSEETDHEAEETSGPLQPKHAYKKSIVSWDIVTQEDRSIEANVMVRWQGNSSTSFINPDLVTTALKDALIYEGCEHSGQTPLPTANNLTVNEPPWCDDRLIFSGEPVVRIVCVAGSDSLRFLSLASRERGAVLRRNACMRCCLALCRENNVHSLIL